MPHYVQLVKFTTQGAHNVKESPKRLEQARKALEAVGGRFVTALYTQGQYDLVVVSEVPSDEVGLAFTLGTVMQGNVTTESLRAYTPEEFAAALARVPTS